MKKKGFTLIELLTVILVIGIIALIAVPITNNLVKKSKEKALEKIETNIEESAYNYSIYNNLGYQDGTISLDELKSKGYLENKDIINPVNNEIMKGCVLYIWINDKYTFDYDEECNLDSYYPAITINVKNSVNSAGWIQENLKFTIDGEYDSIKYCVGSQNCTKNQIYNSEVTSDKTGEGIYICATGYLGETEGRSTCTKAYKVDPEKPTLVVNSIKGTSSTKKITIDASCTDTISGKKDIMYSLNNGEYKTGEVISLTEAGTYNVKLRCRDNALNESYNSDVGTTIVIEEAKNPQIVQTQTDPSQALTTSGWAKERIYTITYHNTGYENPEYYVKSTVDVNINSGKMTYICGNGTTPTSCTAIGTTAATSNTAVDITELQAGYWYKTTNTSVVISYNMPGELYALTKDANNSNGAHQTVLNIDYTNPNIALGTIKATSNSVTIPYTVNDADSGIKNINCNIWDNNGNYYSTIVTNTSCIATGLPDDTEFKYRLWVYDNVERSAELTGKFKTTTVTAPTIVQQSQTPSDTTYKYAQSRTIRITYYDENVLNPSHYLKASVSASASNAASVATGTITHICGNGTMPGACTATSTNNIVKGYWYKTSSTTLDITYSEEGTLYAITTDSEGVSAKPGTYTITNFDHSEPNTNFSITSIYTSRISVKATCDDPESGINKYEFLKNDAVVATYESNDTSYNYTYTGLTSGSSYDLTVRCTNNAGLTNSYSRYSTPDTMTPPVIEPTSRYPEDTTYAQSMTIGITYTSTGIANPEHYVKSTVDVNINSGKMTHICGNGTTPTLCTAIGSAAATSNTATDITTLTAGYWYRTSDTTVSLKYTTAGSIYAMTVDADTSKSVSSTYNILIDNETPSIPTVEYISGANLLNWYKDINLLITSTDNVYVDYYEIDVDNNGTADYIVDVNNTAGTFIPHDGFSTWATRFRAVDLAGNRSSWTDYYHIHKDSTPPQPFTISITDIGTQYVVVNGITTDNYTNSSGQAVVGSGIDYYGYFETLNGKIDAWTYEEESTVIANGNSQLVADLEAGHSYAFYVKACDHAGNCTVSNVVPVDTKPIYSSYIVGTQITLKDGSVWNVLENSDASQSKVKLLSFKRYITTTACDTTQTDENQDNSCVGVNGYDPYKQYTLGKAMSFQDVDNTLYNKIVNFGDSGNYQLINIHYQLMSNLGITSDQFELSYPTAGQIVGVFGISESDITSCLEGVQSSDRNCNITDWARPNYETHKCWVGTHRTFTSSTTSNGEIVYLEPFQYEEDEQIHISLSTDSLGAMQPYPPSLRPVMEIDKTVLQTITTDIQTDPLNYYNSNGRCGL